MSSLEPYTRSHPETQLLSPAGSGPQGGRGRRSGKSRGSNANWQGGNYSSITDGKVLEHILIAPESVHLKVGESNKCLMRRSKEFQTTVSVPGKQWRRITIP